MKLIFVSLLESMLAPLSTEHPLMLCQDHPSRV